MKDDGSGRKIAAHAAVAGILSQITGNGFTSGAAGAGLNEALIKNLKGLDPGTAQIVSAIIGAAAAKVAGRNALAGASAAASGAKWNLLSKADYNEKERRFKEAPDWIEQDKILDEYWEKNLAQEKNEEAEREALEAKGWTTNEIDDYFDNVRYQNHVTFNGDAYYRLGETIIRPYPTRQFWDFAAGIAYSTDENMSFGVMRELYKGITGHSPYSANTSAYHLGRLTGDVASMYRGLQEIAFGMGAMGGGIAAGTTGVGAVTTPALTTAGAAAMAHGGTSAYRASQNFADDLSRFSASTSGKNANDSVDKILEKAVPRPPKRRAEQYDKTGGYDQAEKDFNSLDLEEGSVKDRTGERGKIKTGKLRDGRDVNVREKSSEVHPTLEIIQPNNTRIKIR